MNIGIIIAIVIICLGLGVIIGRFLTLPNAIKIANFKEWLKFAVTEAEKELGSGTGQLKLRMVYDIAIQQFPWIAKAVDFSIFSQWVDEALDWMREQLSSNPAAQDYVDN